MASDVNVAVVLGDPRLPYSYSPEGRFGSDELEAAGQLQEALEQIDGYRFQVFDNHQSLVDDLRDSGADLALNFCDTGFRNEWYRTSDVPALLEVLGLPSTGATPAGIALSDDKSLTHAAAQLRGVPVPKQLFIDLSEHPWKLPEEYPALLKPNVGMGSFGVSETSVVHDPAEAEAQLARLEPHLAVPEVLAQEFLPGEEFTLGLIGNDGAGFVILPPLQVDFSALDSSLPRLLTHGSKVDPESPYWQSLRFRRAELAPDVQRVMEEHCQRIFGRLGLRDYARFDFRCRADGTPLLIDANCNPTWYRNGKMAMMAAWLGYDYPAFLRLILDAACVRHGIA